MNGPPAYAGAAHAKNATNPTRRRRTRRQSSRWLRWRSVPADRIESQLKGVPAKPGVYLFRDADGDRPLRRQGEIAAALASGRTSSPARATRARASGRWRTRVGDGRDDRDADGGRGAPSRAESRQAPPSAVQRAAARRQVVPVHRGHGRGRLPPGHVHARAPSARRRVLRAVREREEGARDPGRPEPRFPLPAV